MRLHLGCGKRYIPGFFHIDLNDLPNVDRIHDIRKLPMIKDGSVDLIYFCHGIEYFDRIEIKKILKEWKRVLKKGGTLRLAVPDFEALVILYQKYKDLDKIVGPLYGRWKIKTKIGFETLYHKTVYDYDSIKVVLENAGFKNVIRYDWKKTIHKNYDDYSQAYFPHMQKDSGLLLSLNVEATK